VATADAAQAFDSSSGNFSAVSRSALGKAHALWRAQKQHAAIVAVALEGAKLVAVPDTALTWRSVLDAVAALNKLLDSNRNEKCWPFFCLNRLPYLQCIPIFRILQ
jgi:hypothetical protein